MTWSRILGVVLIVFAFVPAWAAKLHMDDAHHWDSELANPTIPDMVNTNKEAAASRRSDARQYGAAAVASAVAGVGLLIVPGYLKRRRGAVAASEV
jgi:hypothetical protein